MTEGDASPGGKPAGGVSDDRFIKRALTIAGIVIVVVLLGFVVWFSVNVWLVVFGGILLAVFLRGLADWVSARTRLPSAWSLATVVAALLVFCGLAGWLLAPDAVQQFKELAERLPKAIEQFKEHLHQFGWVRYLVEKLPSASDLGSHGDKLLSRVGGFFSGGMEAVSGFVLILFLGLYLAAAPDVYVRGFIRLFPLAKRDRVHQILKELGATLRNWLLGQLLSMLVVGILIGVGLRLLGIPSRSRWGCWQASSTLFPSSAL